MLPGCIFPSGVLLCLWFTRPGFPSQGMTGAFLIAMPDPAVTALATDPAARVMVFIDGQNLYKRCHDIFRHSLCHPHLLAQYLAGPRTQHPVACRFYTGRPSPNIAGEAEKVRNLDRRLQAMRQVEVTVVFRPLRYHWEWGHRAALPRAEAGLPGRRVMLHPWQRPQEKGIDLVMALDLIEFVLTDKCDVAIVVSLDRDLYEIPQALRNLQRLVGRPVRLEAAVPVPDGLRSPKTLSGFHHTHQITSKDDMCRDPLRLRHG
jgi:uncharacterized LabA/DUF88 family protein